MRSPVMGMAGRMLNWVADTGSKRQSRLTLLFINEWQKEFSAGILHHRKLTSVIREEITRSFIHLHLEPYELFWQSSDAAKPVRVHGELYTFKAFLEAHCELQDATFHGSSWVLCLPLIVLSSQLSVTLNYGQFIS